MLTKFKKKQTFKNTLWYIIVAWFLIFLACIYGYVANLVSLVVISSVLTGMGAARILGVIIPPLGVVLGYF